MTLDSQHKTDKGQSLPGLETGVRATVSSAPSGPVASMRFLRWATGLCVISGVCLAVLSVLGINFSDKDTLSTPVALAETLAPQKPIEAAAPLASPTVVVTLDTGDTGDAEIVESTLVSNATDSIDSASVIGAEVTAELAPVTERIEVTEIAEVAATADVTKKSANEPAVEPANKPAAALADKPAAAPADKPAAAPSKAKPPSIKLFGTVEFRGTLKGVPSWTNMLERNLKNPLLVAGSKLNSSTTWDNFKAKLSTLSPMEQLKAVNRFWNQWPYRLDPEVYKKPDYWATPDEFRRNSGDCEDYSIAKYYTLKEMGIPPDDMRIVVLMETIRNIAHAVLVVYMDSDAWVLDNLSNNVLSHSRYKNYAPQFSVNEKFRWAHVRPK